MLVDCSIWIIIIIIISDSVIFNEDMRRRFISVSLNRVTAMSPGQCLLVIGKLQCLNCCYSSINHLTLCRVVCSQLSPFVCIDMHYLQVILDAVFIVESLTTTSSLPTLQFPIQSDFWQSRERHAQSITVTLLLAGLLDLAYFLWQGPQCYGYCFFFHEICMMQCKWQH